MEIFILLLAIVGFGVWWHMNKDASKDTTPSVAHPSIDFNAPPEKDAYSPVNLTSNPVAETTKEQTTKRPRKPRAPKTEPVKKAASKKPAAAKSTASRGRKPKSKIA